ncbi:MAG: hypothetical protein JNL82_17890 [Myxococcales bacterium]|nr:hypothetical protein [Myxococcales bacterium]
MRSRLCSFLALALVACGPGKADDTDTGEQTTDALTDPIAETDATPTTGDVDPGNPAGLCSPIDFSAGDCPDGYKCCSDDPATVGGRIPNYFQNGAVDAPYGIPIFSGNNNPLSFYGQCVETGGFVSPFASGCPIPCNPTWPAEVTLEICGASSACCQFTAMDPNKDCVLDPDTGLWRAVTGADIPALTSWGSAHATNQDPEGTSCMTFAGEGSGGFNLDAFEDCIAQLTVADQRGFCYAPSECPCKEDVCAQKNPGWVPRCPQP